MGGVAYLDCWAGAAVSVWRRCSPNSRVRPDGVRDELPRGLPAPARGGGGLSRRRGPQPGVKGRGGGTMHGKRPDELDCPTAS